VGGGSEGRRQVTLWAHLALLLPLADVATAPRRSRRGAALLAGVGRALSDSGRLAPSPASPKRRPLRASPFRLAGRARLSLSLSRSRVRVEAMTHQAKVQQGKAKAQDQDPPSRNTRYRARDADITNNCRYGPQRSTATATASRVK